MLTQVLTDIQLHPWLRHGLEGRHRRRPSPSRICFKIQEAGEAHKLVCSDTWCVVLDGSTRPIYQLRSFHSGRTCSGMFPGKYLLACETGWYTQTFHVIKCAGWCSFIEKLVSCTSFASMEWLIVLKFKLNRDYNQSYRQADD